MLSQQTNRKIDSDPAPKNTSIAGNGKHAYRKRAW